MFHRPKHDFMKNMQLHVSSVTIDCKWYTPYGEIKYYVYMYFIIYLLSKSK